jgi:hypothetical protein
MQRQVLSLLGLGLILYSVLTFSAETAFPGVYALFPTIGAALIIYAGSGERASAGGLLVGAVLGWRPLVLIGLISYSLYLWHWPLIVFAKYYALREMTMGEKLGLLMTSMLVATLSWRYIERPFRGKSGGVTRKQLFVSSSLLMAIAIAAGLAVYLGSGFPKRVPQEISEIEDVGNQTDPWRKNCQNLPVEKIRKGDVCALGEKNVNPGNFLLWGDSHALALAPAFDEIAKQKQRSGWFVGKNACPPLLGVERFDSDHSCIPYNEAVTQFIEQHQGIRTVYLAGRWGLHANGHRYGRETGKPSVISSKGMDDNPDAFQQGLERTLAFLKQRDIDVVFMMSVPEVGWLVPSELARAKWFEHPAPLGSTLEAYLARQQPVKEILARVRANNDFRVLEVAPIFCPDGQCLVEHGSVSLYRDDDHLSKQGAQFATQLIADLL